MLVNFVELHIYHPLRLFLVPTTTLRNTRAIVGGILSERTPA